MITKIKDWLYAKSKTPMTPQERIDQAEGRAALYLDMYNHAETVRLSCMRKVDQLQSELEDTKRKLELSNSVCTIHERQINAQRQLIDFYASIFSIPSPRQEEKE